MSLSKPLEITEVVLFGLQVALKFWCPKMANNSAKAHNTMPNSGI